MAIEIKHMWSGGPLRQWSMKKPSNGKWTGLAGGGFVGNYVCERCKRPVDGVYHVREPRRWLCGPCKEALKTTPSAARFRVA